MITTYSKIVQLHKEYVEGILDNMTKFFDVDRFVKNYGHFFNEDLIKDLLADAYMNHNSDKFELINYLGETLNVPAKDIAQYEVFLQYHIF